MILDPTILVCCDRCGVTDEIPLRPGAGNNWKIETLAEDLMRREWEIVGVDQHVFPECAP